MTDGISFKIKVETTGVKEYLAGLSKRMSDTKEAMREIGEIVLASIQRNFEEGGRPDKWPELSVVTIKERESIGKWPGRILVRKGTAGGLMGAISYAPKDDKVVWSAKKRYAAIHHLGGMAGRGHKVEIPARPFMMIQDEDWDEIQAALEDYVMEGKA